MCFCLARERLESMLLIPLSSSLDDGQHTAANKALLWVVWSSACRENMRLQETRCYRKTLKTWKSWALWSSTVCGAEFRAEDQGLMGPLPKHVTLRSINRNGSTMGSFAPYGEAKSTSTFLWLFFNAEAFWEINAGCLGDPPWDNVEPSSSSALLCSHDGVFPGWGV